MDTDADAVMEEDRVLQSTEINGDAEVIEPAEIFPLELLKAPPSTLFHHGNSPSPKLSDSSDDTADDASSVVPIGESSPEAMDGVMSAPVALPLLHVSIPVPKFNPLPYSSQRSGLVYDSKMRFHTEILTSQLDEEDIHPEDPRRIWEIYEELVSAGLVQDARFPENDSRFQLWRIDARQATPAEICLVHAKDHYRWVYSLPDKSDEDLVEMGNLLDSVYLHKMTWLCAMLSAGGAIDACRAVVAGHIKNSIAVIRPPGHHAEPDRPGGFCFFNNVCVAARVCQRDFPDKCRKVLILDWDVHHGNGVQTAFYNDPNVLYISIHVHKNGKFYPTGDYGDHLHCGEGEGVGKNINIPWPCHGMGDGDYMFAFQSVVMPIAIEFDPDLVIVAAGFDAADGDRLGLCHVSPAGYAHMTHMLMQLASGKIAVCLEGGYNLRSIAKSALAVTRTLMGEPPDRMANIEPTPEGVSTVHLVMRQQSRYWKSMYPKDARKSAPLDKVPGERLHDVLRAWQSKVLLDEFQMQPLSVLRERISKSFVNQVLASPGYNDGRPILVIFHDPPEAQGIPDPRTNTLELHNTWITDVTKTYIDWAVKQGFGVIDINVPKYITGVEDDTRGYAESNPTNIREIAANELATYLWENYLELCDPQELFFMGIGVAYSAILHLLSNLETVANNTTHIFNFVAGSALRSVSKLQDENLDRWYYSNSHVFVASEHSVWDPNRNKRPGKRYGKLIQSEYDNMPEMLAGHTRQVFEVLSDMTEEWRTKKEAEQKEEEERKQKEAIRQQELDAATAVFRGGIHRSGTADSSSVSRRAWSPPNASSTANAANSRVTSPLRSPGIRLPPMGTFAPTPLERGSPRGSPRKS